MRRRDFGYISVIVTFILLLGVSLKAYGIVIADYITRTPLPNASVLDKDGKMIGITNNKGKLPKIKSGSYPVTVRYLGFEDAIIPYAEGDTVFLQEEISELPEILIETKNRKLLHILAYVREYSTLSTSTDSVFLFREKMVDFILNPDKKSKFKGWFNPRTLTSQSYYRFTNNQGLDSVSDECNYHFSWSDWIGIAPAEAMPISLRNKEYGTDTIMGKYMPAEIWTKKKDDVDVFVDVLADKNGRKWVPNLAGFFKKNLDFEQFRINYSYDNVKDDSISPLNLSGYSFEIESIGRGHNMFRFNKQNQPFFVNTSANVYILDKEYITFKEAKKWENRKFDIDEIGIYEPMGAPALEASTMQLINRVNNVNKDQIKLNQDPDYRLVSNLVSGRNFKIGRRALLMLKRVTGISQYKSRKNSKNQWNEFRRRQIENNRNLYLEQEE